jgi:hypothetical protein
MEFWDRSNFMEERSIHFNESDNLPEKLKAAIAKKILKNLEAKGMQKFEKTSLTIKFNHNNIKFDYTTGNYYGPIEVIAVNEEQSAPAISKGGNPFHQLFSQPSHSGVKSGQKHSFSTESES